MCREKVRSITTIDEMRKVNFWAYKIFLSTDLHSRELHFLENGKHLIKSKHNDATVFNSGIVRQTAERVRKRRHIDELCLKNK